MAQTNVTLAIDEELLKRARLRAIEQGTSVNAVVRSFLAAYGAGHSQLAMEEFVALAKGHKAGSAGRGRAWQREEVYQERTEWRRS